MQILERHGAFRGLEKNLLYTVDYNKNAESEGATDRKRWKSFKARQKRNVLLPLGATRQMSRASFTEIHKYCYTEPFTF
ncbi:hypothetical protein Bca52824_058026 [Brassica carinata]|uniref:Uncharacterized protein n=1 Tax=Brassica carinata TaxID=52824 RepID=A0A8X7QSQ4_BRACI|nr:hypothetical protein Bca52824_058026 [Brassica carinata]